MITKEDAERIGEILTESKHTYTVKKPDGTTIFVCKYCGAELTQGQMFPHFNPSNAKCCPNIEEKIKLEMQDKKQKKRSITEVTEDNKPVLTPEEEMLERMAEALEEQLRTSPGIDNNKIDWFIRYFKRTKPLQEDPRELYKMLSYVFPKAEDVVLNFIVDTVFEVRNEYMRQRQGYQPRNLSRGRTLTAPIPSMQSYENIEGMPNMSNFGGAMMNYYPPYPTGGFTIQDLIQLFDVFAQKFGVQQQQGLTLEDLEKFWEQKMKERETEELREEIRQLREMIMTMATNKDTGTVTSGEWKDDYVRAITELGTKVLNLGEKIILENKKTRQLLITKVLPNIIGQKEREPGSTDEEVITELEKEGLVTDE